MAKPQTFPSFGGTGGLALKYAITRLIRPSATFSPKKGEKGRQTALRPESPADVPGLESPAIRNPPL
jgi:hypothetical protein